MELRLPPTMAERVAALPRRHTPPPLPLPRLSRGPGRAKVFLGIESFRRHMSNEGWQLQAGLAQAGYQLWGRRLPHDNTNVLAMLSEAQPAVVIMQDKREWDPANSACIAKNEAFQNYPALGGRTNLLKLTVLKDAQHNVHDSTVTGHQLGLHGWITYYHPDMVSRLASYVRPDCLLRTYHGVDADRIPAFAAREQSCLLSGASSPDVYPLRYRLFQSELPAVTKLNHPGYHASGTHTDAFLQKLSQYRVAICTASIYGYALRKIIEATACGCVVITDLPPDEVLPEIDGNLVRVHPDTPASQINELVHGLAGSWNPAKQEQYASRAREWYDYRALCRRLAEDIDRFHHRLLGESA